MKTYRVEMYENGSVIPDSVFEVQADDKEEAFDRARYETDDDPTITLKVIDTARD